MKITLSSGKIIEAAAGTSLLDSLKRSGIFLTSSCGGKGTCGKCRVMLQSGEAEIKSRMKLSQDEVHEGYTLACATYPSGDIQIEIPRESILTVEGKIATGKSEDLQSLLRATGETIDPLTERKVLQLPPPSLDDNISDLERLKRALFAQGMGCLRVPFRFLTHLARTVREGDWKITLNLVHSEDCHEITNIFPGDCQAVQYALAVDIGTTTVVMFLIDLSDGKLIDIASTYNSQIRFGDDVITRIVRATEHQELSGIHEAVITDVNEMALLLADTHRIDINNIDGLVVAGNTTMTHFFLGLDPSSIREEPYIPTANIYPLSYAGELGIKLNQNVPIYAMPCVSSYVGGDIVSGVLASGLHESEELSIFIDIGTNGEIVLGNSEWLMSAACSAGPCFEGSGIRHGMRATNGAIEDVRIDPATREVSIRVIGNEPVPAGICGSGMIDAIAGMFLSGILDQKGKLRQGMSDRVRQGENGLEFVVYRNKGKDIVLTEPDIENIIRAKAAIYAGFTTLLKETGFAFSDVQKVCIAGGFGKFLDVEQAVILGMLPDMPKEKFRYLGNTSVTGAYLCTLSRKLRADAEEISRKMTYMELSVSRSFMDEYVSGLFIPHTNVDDFPRVKGLMKEYHES